jgi:hypothetical protein
MAQAKVITEQELKRALAIIAGRRHADRDAEQVICRLHIAIR